MTARKGGLLLWAWLLICVVEQGQANDLLGIYADALQHDANYAAAQAQQRVGEERQILGRAGLLPQVSLDTQLTWIETQYQVIGGSLEQRRKNRGYGVQLVQPLFRWQNWIEYEQGGLQKVLAEIRLGSAGQALMLRVAEGYFGVLSAGDVFDAVEQLRRAAQEQLASARKQFELGNVSIADVHEAQASFDSTTAQLIKARSNLALARHALARITGRQPGNIRGLRERLELVPPQPQRVNAWVQVAERESLEVQSQEVLLSIASNEVRIRKAGYLPTVDLVLSQNMQQNPNASTSSSESSAIGLRLSMPLYTGGRLGASAREALAREAQAGYELEDTRRTAAFAAREAWSGVVDGMAQVKALDAAKASAQSAVDSNRLGYQLGARVGTDVLNAQSQLSDTVQRLSQARYDTLLALLRLKATVGTLRYVDLAEVNALLRP